jgi:hypothetical protein
MNTPEIEYRDVPGIPDYRVGSDGSVWSRRTRGSQRKKGPWKSVNTHRRPYGARYVVVCFRPEPGGLVVCRYVHRIVLEAFVGPCPGGWQCCHNDGDTSNNSVGNLRWDTPRENNADKIRHGTLIRGERMHRAILTEKAVREIFSLRSEGRFPAEIAEVIGCNVDMVRSVLRRDRWGHVEIPAECLCPGERSLICENCKSPFETTKSKTKYCSKRCSNKVGKDAYLARKKKAGLDAA